MSDTAKAVQETRFLTGNETAAEAAKTIDFHFMGYYPITPSTEIAQLIDLMKTKGEVSTVMPPTATDSLPVLNSIIGSVGVASNFDGFRAT